MGSPTKFHEEPDLDRYERLRCRPNDPRCMAPALRSAAKVTPGGSRLPWPLMVLALTPSARAASRVITPLSSAAHARAPPREPAKGSLAALAKIRRSSSLETTLVMGS